MNRSLLARLLNLFRPHPTPPRPIPTPPPTPTPPVVPPSELVRLINIEREAKHLPALVEDARLNTAAQSWATYMARTGVLDYGDFAGRLLAIYPNVYASENIAEGQTVEDEVVGDWMRSLGHRANLLGDYTAVGVGRAVDARGVVYWCSDFAKLTH